MVPDPSGHGRTRAPAPAAEEVKLVEIKPDRIDLPPSVAGNAFHNLLFGPMAGQPSKATTGGEARTSGLVFWVILALVLFCLYSFRNTDQSTPKNSPPPQPRQAWP
ncbi:MAG TPA: hypothetical protein VGK03_03725 [Geothrix sp.]|jgi:hypothetical protein